MEEASPTKRCFKCGETKPLSEFYKHPEMSDGHVNKCKDCNKKDVIENRLKREEYYNAYDRVRSTLPHRKAAKSEYGKRESVKERKRVNCKKSYEKFPERKAANTAVGNAVRDGLLTKLPCWICGELDVQGHHPDYDSPLDVVWLCTKHHAEIHRDYDHSQDYELLESTKKGNRWDSK